VFGLRLALKGLNWLFLFPSWILLGGFSFHSQPLRLERFCFSRFDPVEVVVLLASSYGAFVCVCVCVFFFFCVSVEGVSGYWFCGFWPLVLCLRQGVSGYALTVWFSFGARSMCFGTDLCDTRLPVVVTSLLRSNSHKSWPCVFSPVWCMASMRWGASSLVLRVRGMYHFFGLKW